MAMLRFNKLGHKWFCGSGNIGSREWERHFSSHNPFWPVLFPDENPNEGKVKIPKTKDEFEKTIFFGAKSDPVIEDSKITGNESETDKFVSNKNLSTSDFFRPTKDKNPYSYLKTANSPFFLFGTKSNESKQDSKSEYESKMKESSFFDEIDLKTDRIHGAYYRVTKTECQKFNENGFIVLPNMLSTSMREEMPLIEMTLMDIMGKLIEFDESKYHSVFDISNEMNEINEMKKENIFLKANRESKKQEITNIYHLSKLLKENKEKEIESQSRINFDLYKANYFELRGLSIARQLSMQQIISRKQEKQSKQSKQSKQEKQKDFALEMINDSCVLIDKDSILSMQNGTFEEKEYKPPQLAQVFNNNDYLYKRELDSNEILLAAMVGVKNSILALNVKDWDNSEYSQNIQLPVGWTLLFDVNKLKQIFCWRTTNCPMAFACNFFGFKR